MRARVCFVVQRYGVEVNGGAELLCRLIAERVSQRHEVEVLTSRAIDYVTWCDHYPPGAAIVNGVSVRRFGVTRERNHAEFGPFTSWLFSNAHTRSDELRWIIEQGPDCPELLDYLKANARNYDAFIFFTYSYLPTCLGLPLVADRALLVPTAHDEPQIYLGIYDEVYRGARQIFFSTPEEMDFVQRRFCFGNRGEIVGMGITPLPPPESDDSWTDIRRQLGDAGLLTYVGRIDESKGCRALFDDFIEYVREEPDRNVKLLLLGKPVMPVPRHPAIFQAGFVSEQTKLKAIAESRVIVIPSLYESLSIIALEAWALGRPVLVNGQCEVLRGQCRRSNGGLWYTDRQEFRQCLNRILADPELGDALGKQGRQRVLKQYSWQRVDAAYDRFIGSVCNYS